MARMTKRFPDGKTVVVCDSCEQKMDKQCTFDECRTSLIKRLAAYEDTGLEPEAVETVKLALAAKHLVDLETLNNTPISRLVELVEADKDGRVVVLPCKYDERWADEDGRTVRITATTATVDDFGTHITIYFTYEDATSCDDADSDCTANWDYFSRRFTCVETVLDNRKEADHAAD